MIDDYSYEYRAGAASILLGEQPAVERVLIEVYELSEGIEGLTFKQLLLILQESASELKGYWV